MPIEWRKKDFGNSEPFIWENEMFDIVKARKIHTCHMCDKKINKGCYALGRGYWRVCLKCADKFMENHIKSLKKQISRIKKKKKNLEENKPELDKNNLINSL